MTKRGTAATGMPPLPPARLVAVGGRGPVAIREVVGPPGAPVLFLLHGWTVTADLNWYPVFDRLGERYRVIAFDHRGHGRSAESQAPFTLEGCADDALALADALGIETFTPVGYSMGGPVAMLIWRRAPERVRAIVLCATACRFASNRLVRIEMRALGGLSRMTRVLPRRLTRHLFDTVAVRRAKAGELSSWAVREITGGNPRLVLQAGAALGRFDARGWLSEADVPTSVIVMDDDTILSARLQNELAETLRSPHVLHLPGDHDVCLRHPERFVSALLDACEAVLGSFDRSGGSQDRGPVPAPR
jgi:3-oxoadipate enol-lactonase